MGNTFITSSIILAEALDIFVNSMKMGNLVYKDYAKEFKGTPKIGEFFSIRNPWRFDVQDGPTINLVDLVETDITMSITAHKVIPMQISVRDRTMKVDDFRKKYLADAMNKLANQVDMDLAACYKDIYQAVGIPGVTPNAYSVFGDAATKLDFMSCPQANRNTVLDPPATYSMADALKGLFNPGMVEDYIKKGKLTEMAGNGGIYSTQNMVAHTAGTAAGYKVAAGGAVLVGSTPESTGTMNVDTGTGIPVIGDVFVIDGLYALNPVNYQSTGQLQQITIAATPSGAGTQTWTISPALIISGPNRNVSGTPTATNNITFLGSHKANLVFHEKAIALATVPFELPETAAVKEQLSDNGITMTLTGGYDITNFREIYRLDILYAVKTIRPEWACRICG